MLSRSVFYRILAFSCRIQCYKPPKKLNNAFHENSSYYWKELKWFHSSIANYKLQSKNKEKIKLERQIKKKSVPPVEVWEKITVKEIADIFKCGTDIIETFIPEVDPDYELNKQEITIVAKNLQKKFIVIQNPKNKSIKKDHKNVEFHRQPPPKPEILVKRPPVVTVMGHVDHGKTTLLDSLRNTFVVDQEFGGITQHIGAFSVQVKSGEKITFIDTPGHAAFTTMRARGAEVTDIVVLVIAADDGIMDQTIESINIAKRAHVKIIVAVNKIDKPKALSIDVIKDKLLLEGIQVEDKGGDVQLVPISALKKINLDILTETILLEAELMNLKGDPTGLVEGVIIEAKIDKQGALATLIIKRGTLKKGKILLGGLTYARVRSMIDENGKQFNEAPPSTPVQVLGWKELPVAGDEVFEVATEKFAHQIIRVRKSNKMREKQAEDLPIISENAKLHHQKYQERRLKLKSLTSWSERKLFFKEQKELESKKVEQNTHPTLNLILKGDVNGSLEVLLEILTTYDQEEECHMCIVDASVGNVTQSDLEIAETFNAIIYAFNVDVHSNARELLKQKNIDIRMHNVLYKMIDDLKSELSSRIKHKDVEKIIGEAIVNQNFYISKGKKKIPVAGCKCIKGELSKNAAFKIIREDKVLYQGKVHSMKHHKTEVNSILKNVECGIMFESFLEEFQASDKIICYQIMQVPQNTSWNPGF